MNRIGRRNYYTSEEKKAETALQWENARDEAWESIAEQMIKESAFFMSMNGA